MPAVFMIGGPKKKDDDEYGGNPGKSESTDAEMTSAKAVMGAVKSGDVGELKKAMSAFVRACMAKGEEY